jgi:hypothetical protein
MYNLCWSCGINGAQVKGVSMVELGSGNRPLDLFDGQGLDLAAFAFAIDDEFLDAGCLVCSACSGRGEKEGEGGYARNKS